MERLRSRSEFKAVAGGQHVARSGFVLQALPAGAAAKGRPARFGITVTRKVGNAVVRNRVRRRLRAAIDAAAGHAEAGTDYVMIARRAALTLQFDRLVTDLVSGFAAVTGGGGTEDNRP
jgi:ribonuclease P protein component